MQNVTVGQNVKNIQILPIASRTFLIGQSGTIEPRWNIWNILAPIWIEYSASQESQTLLLRLHANLSNSII
jgi:hypothetical protein